MKTKNVVLFLFLLFGVILCYRLFVFFEDDAEVLQEKSLSENEILPEKDEAQALFAKVSELVEAGVNKDIENVLTVAYAGHVWYVIGATNAAGEALPGSVAPANFPNGLTLLAKNFEPETGAMVFSKNANNEYLGSVLFSAIENMPTQVGSDTVSLVAPRMLEGGSGLYGTPDYDADKVFGASPASSQGFWQLSAAEANEVNPSLRSYGIDWWLRTPGGASNKAAFVSMDGTVSEEGVDVGETLAIRPVFWLKLENVIFTTRAYFGKPAIRDPIPTPITASYTSDATIKFTVKTASLGLLAASWAISEQAGEGYARIIYGGATQGRRLEAMLIRDGMPAYYWLLDDVAAIYGSADIKLPEDYDPVTDSVAVFVVERGELLESDFASAPVFLEGAAPGHEDENYENTTLNSAEQSLLLSSGDAIAILPAKGAGAKPFVQSSEPTAVGGSISGEAQLTLVTRELMLSSAGANIERVGDAIAAKALYIGATPKKRLEAMLLRNGELKYWWLLSTSTNEWGQALFALPEDYDEDSDKVYLFVSESGAEEGRADFVSKPVRIL